MKLIDFVIVFIIIILPFGFTMSYQYQTMERATYKQIEMNNILDCAVSDGVTLLVEKGDGHKIQLNKDRCISTFYNTLFVNFNITCDEYAKVKLMGYIPVIAILDYDGYYTLSCETFLGKDHLTQLKPVWQPKKPFTYTDGDYIYGFTMDDYVSVYNTSTGVFIEGKQEDLKGQIEDYVLHDENLFDEIRRRTIIETLKTDISQLINQHNDVARQFGISYQFSLPVIEDEDWYQTVDSIGMLAFFQGMPMGIDGGYYNQYAFGGAQLFKGEGFYVQEDLNSGLPYYHRSTCSLLTEKKIRFSSQEECALEGAFPCDECKP